MGEEKVKPGQLVKGEFAPAHPITIPQLPSYSIEQIRGMMPVQLQNIWTYHTGETDGFQTISNMLGLGITKVRKPEKQK
jgi:hypothetical protein